MTKNDDPWEGLNAGGIDARRVNPSSSHDFFWIVSRKIRAWIAASAF